MNSKHRIVLGLMTFGPDENLGARITSLDDFKSCLDLFQRNGYNEVDTARLYVGGRQESFTAQVGWKNRGLKLATKWYPHQPGAFQKEVLRVKLEESLRELQTSSVNIFYLHAADRSTPFTETLEMVDELHKEGKFIQFGLSNFSAFEVAEIVTICNERGWVRPTVYQAVYNAISRTIESELIPCCRRYGIEILIFNPLAGGLLTGRYKSAEMPEEGRFSNKHGAQQGQLYRARYFKDSTFKVLGQLLSTVNAHGLTMTETALRWCIHHSALNVTTGNDGVILGVSSYEQLEMNMRDVEKGPLPKEVVQALDDAWMTSKAMAPDFWHGKLEYSYDTQKALFASRE